MKQWVQYAQYCEFLISTVTIQLQKSLQLLVYSERTGINEKRQLIFLNSHLNSRVQNLQLLERRVFFKAVFPPRKAMLLELEGLDKRGMPVYAHRVNLRRTRVHSYRTKLYSTKTVLQKLSVGLALLRADWKKRTLFPEMYFSYCIKHRARYIGTTYNVMN